LLAGEVGHGGRSGSRALPDKRLVASLGAFAHGYKPRDADKTERAMKKT
jgi:hypothetical protein